MFRAESWFRKFEQAVKWNPSYMLNDQMVTELHLEHPFMGARMLRDQLKRMGFKVGRRHVSTLMKKMGIEALIKNLERVRSIQPIRSILIC